jgi:hypothetical protein
MHRSLFFHATKRLFLNFEGPLSGAENPLLGEKEKEKRKKKK